MRLLLLILALVSVAANPARAQVTEPTPSAARVPRPASEIPPAGELDVSVWAVVAKTKSTVGPYTAFLVAERREGLGFEPPPNASFWVYVRSDDNVGALERGSLIGILLGAVETNRWTHRPVGVRIRYETTPVGKEVFAASIGGVPLGHE